MLFHQCSNLGRNSHLFQQKPDSLCSLPDTLSRWCKGCNSLHLRFSQCQQWFSGSFQTTLVPSEVRIIEVPNKVGRHCLHRRQLAIPNSHQDNCLDLSDRPSVSKVQSKQCLNIHTSSGKCWMKFWTKCEVSWSEILTASIWNQILLVLTSCALRVQPTVTPRQRALPHCFVFFNR